jgi:hypothetical protein
MSIALCVATDIYYAVRWSKDMRDVEAVPVVVWAIDDQAKPPVLVGLGAGEALTPKTDLRTAAYVLDPDDSELTTLLTVEFAAAQERPSEWWDAREERA